MKKTNGRVLAMMLVTLAVAVIAFCTPVKAKMEGTYKALGSGPDRSTNSMSYVLINAPTSNGNAQGYLFYCVNGTESAVSRSYGTNDHYVAYDSSTNTLTLKDMTLNYIETAKMGDGFTIKLVGNNYVEAISLYATLYNYSQGRTDNSGNLVPDRDSNNNLICAPYGNNCTFTGTGSLTSGQIYLDAGFTKSYVKIGGSTRIELNQKGYPLLLAEHSLYEKDPTQVFRAKGLSYAEFTITNGSEKISNWVTTFYNFAFDGSNRTLVGDGSGNSSGSGSGSSVRPSYTPSTSKPAAAATTSAPAKTKVKSITSMKKALKVKWNKKSCTGYQIQVSTKVSFPKSSRKSKTVLGGSKTSAKISGLKKKKTYYVRIRTFNTGSNGTIKYSGWSGIKMKKTK